MWIKTSAVFPALGPSCVSPALLRLAFAGPGYRGARFDQLGPRLMRAAMSGEATRTSELRVCRDEYSQFCSNATVPRPPSAQMLTMARLPCGIAASSFTA